MGFARVVLVLSALVFAALGAGFVFWPRPLAAALGIALTSTLAHNDFRAVYGGVPAGLALFFVLALRRPAWEAPALAAVAATLGGLAATRFFSWLVDGWPAPLGFAVHAAEVAGTLLALAALRVRAARGAVG